MMTGTKGGIEMRRKRRQASRVFIEQEVNYGKETGIKFRTLSGKNRRDFKESERDERTGRNSKDSSIVGRVKPAP
jgi:hypothetical protein